MIRRFCLYGFLKNQQYYEPFLILAFLEKGISFLEIGILIGFREICILLMEIPSGAVADTYGRRNSMILSFFSYIIAFIIFALSDQLLTLYPAMFFFSVGHSFRTGTHKALIFEWLRQNNRLGEKTKIYGLTRSWSKIGSATSALAAAVLVIVMESYTAVFWLCVVPYFINIINFLGYPKSLDQMPDHSKKIKSVFSLAFTSVKHAVTQAQLRRLFVESMLFEGIFKVTKDYLQPLLKTLALTIPLFSIGAMQRFNLSGEQKSAVIIGVVYSVYFLLMSLGSKLSHKGSKITGSDNNLTNLIWKIYWVLFIGMGICFYFNLVIPVVVGLIGLGFLQNLFKPAHISRFDAITTKEMAATVLSVESQSKAIAAAVFAPIIGWLVDRGVTPGNNEITHFWPIALLGITAGTFVLLFVSKKTKPAVTAKPVGKK